MKLRVDVKTARKIYFEPSPDGPELPKSVVLQLNIEQQQLEHWCWAAISASIGCYYRTGDWRQQQLANEVLGMTCSGAAMSMNQQLTANHPYYLDWGLLHVGCLGHWSKGKPPLELLQYEINAERPVCLRIAWFTGGAHYVVIKGYNPRTGDLYVEDPLHGFSMIRYRDFPSKYHRAGGIWTETFWTQHPTPARLS